MRSFKRQRGQAIPFLVSGTLVMIGFCAMVLDFGGLYLSYLKVRNYCDLSVLAGAAALPGASGANAAALIYARNLGMTTQPTPTSTSSSVSGYGVTMTDYTYTIGPDNVTITTPFMDDRVYWLGLDPNRVIRVKSTRTVGNNFGKVIGFPNQAITRFAVAHQRGPEGLVALNATMPNAVSAAGNAQVLRGNIRVNSSNLTAVSTTGNATISAGKISIYGGYSGTGFSPLPTTGVPPLADPLSGLAAPSTVGTSLGTATGGTISPGIYDAINVTSGTLTMQPGVYVIKGGGVSLSGTGSVTGTGVMIYNTFNDLGTVSGSISLSGSGRVNLSAPTSGTYSGILIFQDGWNNKTMSLTGNSLMTISGTIYLPWAALSLAGNANLQSNAIADSISVAGNAVLQFDPLAPVPLGKGTMLIE